jgi:UDP-N-acetyl-D-galactosamine dehydrogenase
MTSVINNAEPVIGIIGLGYVGLPLAVAFGNRYRTIGFDINVARIAELRAGKDSSLECTAEELASAPQLSFTTELDDLGACTV